MLDPALEFGGRLALCGGVAVFLLGVVANHWAAPDVIQGGLLRTRLAVGRIVILLLLVGGILPPAVLVALVALLLAGLPTAEFSRPARAVPRRRATALAESPLPGYRILFGHFILSARGRFILWPAGSERTARR